MSISEKLSNGYEHAKKSMYPNAFASVLGPLSIRTSSTERGRNQNFTRMHAFLYVTTRAALAGLGALAFCKLVDFSPRNARLATYLGIAISPSTTLLGLGSFALYKGLSILKPAFVARSLSGVAAASALLLGGWLVLNNSGKIADCICENVKFRGVDKYINPFNYDAANQVADYFHVPKEDVPQT